MCALHNNNSTLCTFKDDLLITTTMFLRACTASCSPLTACRVPSWLRHFGHGAGAGLVEYQVATHVWHPISEWQHVANIGCAIGPEVNHCGHQLFVKGKIKNMYVSGDPTDPFFLSTQLLFHSFSFVHFSF